MEYSEDDTGHSGLFCGIIRDYFFLEESSKDDTDIAPAIRPWPRTDLLGHGKLFPRIFPKFPKENFPNFSFGCLVRFLPLAWLGLACEGHP